MGWKNIFKGGRGRMWKDEKGTMSKDGTENILGGRGKMWKGGKGMEEGKCVMVGKGKHI